MRNGVTRTVNQIVRDLQLLARKESGAYNRALIIEAAEWIWDYANQGDDERTPMPCPDCGSHSTECGCDERKRK